MLGMFLLAKPVVDRLLPPFIFSHFSCLGGGNAAGFLAKQGLLMSGSGRGHEKENNSSDTDSDTEEYLSNVHRYLSIYTSNLP